MIPIIDVRDVLAGQADTAILGGASGSGFLTLSHVDQTLGLSAPRQNLLAFFNAESEIRQTVLRNKYDPASPYIYRGYFPSDPSANHMVDGYDIGPDIADPSFPSNSADPLTEPTPRPDLPGWQAAAARYYSAMDTLGRALTRSVLRGIGKDEALVDRLFNRSISTLRLFRYPAHDPAAIPQHRHVPLPSGETRYMMTGEHTDSGFVTLLWQDQTGGLQARGPNGAWIDVPPAPDGLVVNFGQMIEDWTAGRIKATPHRVIGGVEERFSVPFFFEPAVDARIEPLFEGAGAPFVYGDFLWERMMRFPTFQGVTRRP
ncbi:MAG: 2OG-Fe(II) oxygenase family protein, partial [Pseudomonadota bacterium]